MTQKLIKLAFTIDKCCALSTIAKVSTYFPILMIGGRRVNAFFYVNYQKYRKLSQACLDLGLLLAILSIDHDVKETPNGVLKCTSALKVVGDLGHNSALFL